MQKKAHEDLVAEVHELRIQLEEAQETLNAIRRGEVDGLVVSTHKGEQVYTISGADRPYRVLIEEMREGAVMLSSDNTILYCNSGFAKMIKYPMEKIVGSCVQNMVLSTHMTDFEELLAQGRTGKGSMTKEITLHANDDKLVQTLMSINSFKMDNIETTFLITTDLTEHMEEDLKRYTNKLETEITERKKAEETLLSKKRELASIYASVPEVLFFLSINPGNCFRFLSVSKSFLQVTGLNENQVVGKRVQEVIPQPSLSLVLEKYEEAISERKTMRWQEVTDYPAGKKYGEVSVTPIYDLNGHCTNLIGLVYDITERKKAEEALKASEEKANQLIKYAPSGIYELDYRIPPKFRSVNDAMCQILGYTREELLATSPFALLDDESQRRFRERIMKMLAGEKVDETVEFKVIPKDEREIYAVLNTTFTYKNEKPDGALVIAHDVTERKKVERALEKRAKNLESLVEERTKALRDSERLAAIGATAGMVGHDIRNPLQAIISDVYLAKTELASISDSEEKKNTLESLQEIEKNVDYINKIVADLQDFVKPLNPHTEETDLQLVIRDLLSKNSLPKNINVSVKVDDEARKIVADATFINRILYNLVTNAVQAMPNGGELKIHASKEANDVIMTVKDTGVGIPEKAKGKLFTPLFTTKSKGQGFGLAVVKRMTESLGGTVTFESEEGKGTTFFVRLPFKKDKT